MEENKNIYRYAFYNIAGKDFYQYLPSSNLADVIYVRGMKSVREKSFIKDGDYFIEIGDNSKSFMVGEFLKSSDIVRRYKAEDPVFQDYDEDTIAYLSKNPNAEWTLYGDGDVLLGRYNDYIPVNNGEIPIADEPSLIVKSDVHWYLELEHEDGSITYEKTKFDDRKYRGQSCNFYSLVKVAEYNLNDSCKRVIIERGNEKLPYKPIIRTELDDIIDQAKGLIIHETPFEGFSGVSLLYTFNTEDSACVFYDNQDKVNNSVVTTVTGSGDAILDLFLYGARKIIAFDTNVLTVFYGELKFIAAKYLTFALFKLFFATFDENIYRQLAPYLSFNARKFFDELYEYGNLVEKPIKDSQNGGLFYPTATLFAANSTFNNEKGYYNEENYSRLQQALKDKTLDDISFLNCDLFELPNKVDLKESSYVYLSNIMDFVVGVDEYRIDDEKLRVFKDFILNGLSPALKEGADIELSYISQGWHPQIESNYFRVYPNNEGFSFYLLSNGRDSVLSFRMSLWLKNNNEEAKRT